VIADTHGLLRPEVQSTFRHCDLILHAGDVGNPEVLRGLAGIAPVVAVRGNVDHGAWAGSLPLVESVFVGHVSILLIHDVNDLDSEPDQLGHQVVVSGHSHRPRILRREDVLYLNPGSAGPRRFRLPVAVALLTVQGGQLDAEIRELAVPSV
jgi:putative phosphoesterase